MKIFRKLAAALAAAVIAVSACASMAMNAGADSIYDTATAVSSGKSVSSILPAYGDTADYKVTVSESGALKLSVESHMYMISAEVYDSDGNVLSTIDNSATSGYCTSPGKEYCHMEWNDTIEKFKGSVSYSVKPGTYYIRFTRLGTSGKGKFSFTATCPTSSAKAKISYITIKLEKGDTLSLGAALSGGSGSVTWKSSKPSSVTVSTAGKITAKAKGSAIITAKCGSSSKKIKIIVS